jgi:hypothetical protein
LGKGEPVSDKGETQSEIDKKKVERRRVKMGRGKGQWAKGKGKVQWAKGKGGKDKKQRTK